jgi:hypothetical protein
VLVKNKPLGPTALPPEKDNLVRRPHPLEGGAGGGHDGGMEARVAVLEQIAKTTADTLIDIKVEMREIRSDLRAMREKHDVDFRITFAAGTAAVLSVVALMAKGFHWF